MRAVLSLVVAVVTTVVGEALLWGGGAVTLRSAQEVGGVGPRAIPPGVVALIGIVLVSIAMLTAAWSSLGVIVVGIVHLVVGGAALVLSPAVYLAVLRPLEDADRDVAGGVDYAAATGMLLLTGVVLVVGGIALAARRARSSPAGRATSLVLALVLGIGLLPLVLIGGSRVVQAVLLRLSPVVELLGAGLVLSAAVLLVIVVATVRWSSLGAFVIGVILAAAGFVSLFAPAAVARPLALAPDLEHGASYIAMTGELALLGMLLVVTAIAGLVRAARRRAQESVPEVEERIGYQPEQPADDGLAAPIAPERTPRSSTGDPPDRV